MKGYRLGAIGFLVAVFLTACTNAPEVELPVRECAPLPEKRACATAFVVDHQAYVFAGRDSAGVAKNDLWRYTPSTDSWEHLGATPLKPRVNPTSCVREGKVYIGLGFNGAYWQDSCYLQDFWEYTPSTNSWQRLADYPNAYTDAATSFAGEGALYVGYGYRWNYRRDMFRYDISLNRWDSIDVGVSFFGYPIRSFGGTGCTCNGRHFMGTGYYRNNLNWWAELVDGTHWEKRSPVPGRERVLAASTASKDYIYVVGGLHYGGVNTNGEALCDIRRYDPTSDRWQFVAVMPEGLYNHVSFAIDGKVYWGLGEDKDIHVTNRLYCIEEEK